MKKRLWLFAMVLILACCVGCGKGKEETNSEALVENTDETKDKEKVEADATEEVVEVETPEQPAPESEKKEEAAAPVQQTPEQPAPTKKPSVADLEVAKTKNQIIIVSATGNSATLSMHNKNADGTWTTIIETNAMVGDNGVGQAREGVRTTPVGLYSFTIAFGIKPNPGTSLPYTQVDDTYYWVDDSNSAYYNKFVTTNEVTKDWNSAEHIIDFGETYDYAIAINYNPNCVPGLGSAFFLHGSSTPNTGGCVGVPHNVMLQIMKQIQPGCVIIIDNGDNVYNY